LVSEFKNCEMTNVDPISWRGFWWYQKWSWVLESLGGSLSMVCFGWILHCDDKKKNQMQHRFFWGFFGKFSPYFQGKLLKVAMLRYYIHKSYQYKIRFWKKIYNPSRLEIFILGDFKNVKGFLFWVGPFIMPQWKKKTWIW